MYRTISFSIIVGIFAAAAFCGTNMQKNVVQYTAASNYLAKRGEVYFRFALDKSDSRGQIGKLTNIISLDNVQNGYVYAYANKSEFEKFVQSNQAYEVLPPPGEVLAAPKMASAPAAMSPGWNAYPTYQAYVDMMTAFGTNFPDKCKIIQIGSTVKGKKLLYAKITANVNLAAKKPQFAYSSTMHGDEVNMYVQMLRLIDYLLNNYATDAYVKKLVDSVEIWICPLENPDGAYFGGDATVSGAVRYNANNVDLNRTYPNFSAGPHPDGQTTYQPECQAVMTLEDSCQFVMSANFHAGAELLNYPWDTKAALHQDDAWMQYVYGKFRDTVHVANATYITQQSNGITNGYAWYQVFGSRQDYITHHRYGREVTIETSVTKLLPADQLPDHWTWIYKSLLQLIEQCQYGIKGTVIDSVTRLPLVAKVFVNSHDSDPDSTFTMSKKLFGDYYRPIAAATWTVAYSCTGYKTKTVSNIAVVNNKATVVNVELCPNNVNSISLPGNRAENDGLRVQPFAKGAKITLPAAGLNAVIYDMAGKAVWAGSSGRSGEIFWNGISGDGTASADGYYFVKAQAGSRSLIAGFTLSR
jgi:hypothetical protein